MRIKKRHLAPVHRIAKIILVVLPVDLGPIGQIPPAKISQLQAQALGLVQNALPKRGGFATREDLGDHGRPKASVRGSRQFCKGIHQVRHPTPVQIHEGLNGADFDPRVPGKIPGTVKSVGKLRSRLIREGFDLVNIGFGLRILNILHITVIGFRPSGFDTNDLDPLPLHRVFNGLLQGGRKALLVGHIVITRQDDHRIR